MRLYDYFQINFLYPVKPVVLNTLASGLVAENSISRLLKVYEQYLKYILLEENLFMLNSPSFEMLQQPGKSDYEIEAVLEDVALGLFSVLKTCKIWPIIRAGRGFSEIVANKLAEMCWENPDENSHLARPLLLIIDRSIDLSVMFHHPWTYQALTFDVFRNSLNKVLIPGNPPQLYELDKNRDGFWKEQSSIVFGDVLQNIDKSFKDWKEKYDKMGNNISKAFDSVPEMTEKKTQLDLHMNLATQLVDQVQSRHLDQFNQIEELLMNGKNPNISELLALQPGPTVDPDTFEADKFRLQIISFLQKNLDTLPDVPLQEYLRSLRGEVEQQSTFKFLSGFAEKVKGKLMGHEKMLPITKMVHSVLENKQKQDLEYYDTIHKSGQKYKREYTEAIIFVVGGGNYAEFHNLMHYAQKVEKTIIYGSTDLPTSTQFLEQLQRLSKL